MTVVGIDLGCTTVAAALLRERELGPAAIEHTETCGQAGLLDQLVALVDRAKCGKLEAVGVGVPSVVEFETGRVISSVNVPLVDVPIRQVLGERLGVPVFVDNDARSRRSPRLTTSSRDLGRARRHRRRQRDQHLRPRRAGTVAGEPCQLGAEHEATHQPAHCSGSIHPQTAQGHGQPFRPPTTGGRASKRQARLNPGVCSASGSVARAADQALVGCPARGRPGRRGVSRREGPRRRTAPRPVAVFGERPRRSASLTARYRPARRQRWRRPAAPRAPGRRRLRAARTPPPAGGTARRRRRRRS